MDHRDYYHLAVALHKQQKAALDGVLASAIGEGLAKIGSLMSEVPSPSEAIARHQEIVAEMANLGSEYRGNA